MTIDAGRDAWQLTFLEDLALPGWFLVPVDADEAATLAWRAEMHEAVGGSVVGQGDAKAQAIEEELDFALEVAADGPPVALFQIWPIDQPLSILCRVDLVDGAVGPEVPEGGRLVVHDAAGRHLGAGRQYSIERTLEIDSEPVNLMNVQYVFTDGRVSLVFATSEAPAPLLAHVMLSFTELKDALALRSSDGSRFEAVPVGAMSEDWPLEDVTPDDR